MGEATGLPGKSAAFSAAAESRYRAAPFWGWNGTLNETELLRQLDLFAEAGFGGFYIHSREGLETPFLGPVWFDRVKAVVKRAAELGLEAWIYDEDRWPSGFAGGRVPARGDDYRAKGLTIEIDAALIPPDAVAAYAYRPTGDGSGDRIDSCRRLAAGSLPGAGERLAVLRVEIANTCDWFNGEAPPDNLNPACVDAFLSEAYAPYEEAVGEYFGSTVKGFFYDEPGVHDRHVAMTGGRGWIPWTGGFPAFFAERRGYDLLDRVPLVFFDAEEAPAVRHDYWRTLSERFSETFTGRISAWCAERGLQSSGHFLWEGDLGVSTRVCGSIMPNYRIQHLPGIDILGISDAETSTVKQCASVVRQAGKDRLVSEMYGCAGWDLDFERQKWHGDWQAALGVNLRCQHHALETLRGCRKRDYPPSFNYHTPWFSRIRDVEDYFARVNAALDGTDPVREILVLHPASTAWARAGSSPRGFTRRGADRDLPALKEYGEEFNALLRLLTEEHLDCDVGDELVMEGGAATTPDGLLRVGRCAYRAVVVPESDSLLGSTFRILTEFAARGGLLIALGRTPAMIEGRPSAELAAFFAGSAALRASGAAEAAAALAERIGRPLDPREADGRRARKVRARLGDAADHSVVFLANGDRERTVSLIVSVERKGALQEWDPRTGKRRTAESAPTDRGCWFAAELGPAESRIFVLDRSGASTLAEFPLLPRRRRGAETAGAPLDRPTRVEATMPNALVIDRARVRIGDGPDSPELYVWEAQERARETLGMPQVWANELRQRYLWARKSHPRDGSPVAFVFGFEAEEAPERPVRLALEGLDDVSAVSMNGVPVPLRPDGFYLDRSLETIPLPAPRIGRNELVVEYRYRLGTEVEDVAVVGDFAVRADRRLRRAERSIGLGDWRSLGYFHYPGSLVYHFTVDLAPAPGERYELEVGERRAATVAATVNGKAAGSLPWRSCPRIDLTPFLVAGSNDVGIEIVGSPRNFFGPFHCAGGPGETIDWSKFRPRDGARDDGYETVPYGLIGPVRVIRIIE